MREGRWIVCALALLATGGGAAMSSCGGAMTGSSAQDGGGGPDATTCGYGGCSDGGGTSPTAYEGGYLTNPVNDCPGIAAGTTIRGKVYDPAGKNPLYGVVVENPANAPIDLSMVHQGASCAACTSLYTQALAYTYTDETGSFTIKHAASDTGGMPTTLVVQAGKWRSVYQVHITACQDNVLPDRSIRLPGKADPDGGASLPDIAISTGAADSLECLLRRMGVDDSEFVAGADPNGHVHIFSAQNDGGTGAVVEGGSPDPSQNLWDTQAHLMRYDVVLFSCEGAETNGLTDSARTNLYNYASNGGRTFLSHYHYAWFTPTGPFSTSTPPVAAWLTGDRPDNDPVGGVVSTTTADGGPFPEGVSMGKWLANVGAAQDGGGLYPIHDTHDNATVTSASTKTQVWLTADDASASPGNAQYLSMDLPMSVEVACGRVVYSELHAGGVQDDAGVGVDYAGSPSVRIVPSGCADRDLTPQEKALEFMVFNLSSCLVPRGQKPQTHPPM